MKEEMIQGKLTERMLVNEIMSPTKIEEQGMFANGHELILFYEAMISLVEKYKTWNNLLFQIAKQNLKNIEKILQEKIPDYMTFHMIENNILEVKTEMKVLTNFEDLEFTMQQINDDEGVVFKHKYDERYLIVFACEKVINVLGYADSDYDGISQLIKNEPNKYSIRRFILSDGKFNSLMERLYDSLKKPRDNNK